jgi:hypothetical protein
MVREMQSEGQRASDEAGRAQREREDIIDASADTDFVRRPEFRVPIACPQSMMVVSAALWDETALEVITRP